MIMISKIVLAVVLTIPAMFGMHAEGHRHLPNSVLNGNPIAEISMQRAVHQTPLVPGAGWQSFFFGGVGSFDEFTLTTDEAVMISITDDFCVGDRFELVVNGVSQGLTSLPDLQLVCDGPGVPTLAFEDLRFSKGQFALGPGTYTLRVVAVASPFNAGGAWIRADAIGECSTNDYSVLSTSFGIIETGARSACQVFGRILADLTSANFISATQQAFDCSGAFQRLWVNSWNGVDYGTTCIALHLGVQAPGGTIVQPDGVCIARILALCQ